MSEELKDPEGYAADMEKLRSLNTHAESWVLRLRRPCNKHPEICGALEDAA